MCIAGDTSTPLCTQSCNSQQHSSSRMRSSIEFAANLQSSGWLQPIALKYNICQQLNIRVTQNLFSKGPIVAARASIDSSSTASISKFPIIVKDPLQGLAIDCKGNCTFAHNGMLYKVINGAVFLVGNVTSITSYVTLTTPITSYVTLTTPINGVCCKTFIRFKPLKSSKSFGKLLIFFRWLQLQVGSQPWLLWKSCWLLRPASNGFT